jgi:hypothetical protein
MKEEILIALNELKKLKLNPFSYWDVGERLSLDPKNRKQLTKLKQCCSSLVDEGVLERIHVDNISKFKILV